MHDTFDPRRNSLDMLRLLFASLVAVSHGIVMHTGWQPRFGLSNLGDFGLDGFFILSGFLVTRSFCTLGSPARYLWHRILRIMPGFWVCLAITALVAAPVAALLRGLPVATAFTEEPTALRYLLGNAALVITQYDIAGLLAHNPNGDSFNGALWTLAFEALCYLIVLFLGITGILRRRRWVVPVLAVALTVMTILQEAGVPPLINPRLTRLILVFLLGATAYLYARRIPIHAGLGLAALATFLAGVTLFDDYRALGAAPLAYVIVWAGTRFPWHWSMRADLSYGVYIYHWPLFQLLVLTGIGTLPTAAFVPAGLALVLIPAALSWYLIEKPALGRKHSPFPDRAVDLVRAATRRALRRPAPSTGTGRPDADPPDAR